MGYMDIPADAVVVPYISVYPEMGDAYCYKNCGWRLRDHGLVDDGTDCDGGGTTVCPKKRASEVSAT